MTFNLRFSDEAQVGYGSVPDNYITGCSPQRIEDAALLSGLGRYADDFGVRAGSGQAAILRSSYAHAIIASIDAGAALALNGVYAVLTGADMTAGLHPFTTATEQPLEYWPLAVDRVRYTGEPVAIVIAENRYIAEDALELIAVEYQPLPVVVDPLAALAANAPLLHPALESNLLAEERCCYGDPQTAFADAAHTVTITVHYPRSAGTPLEGYVVLAEYHPATGSYEVLANFSGPFALHVLIAQALGVPGNKLQICTPADSGGSFGNKQALFPYIVALCLAARKAGRPVKWVEDRCEHLSAATAAANSVTTLAAAVDATGGILALRYDQLDDCGACLRAPEPLTRRRLHGNLSGAYRVRHVEVRNRLVATNKPPSGLNRGAGGSQLYYALERLMQRIAIELDLDPLDVIRRNLIPAGSFPYRCPAGAVLDSGDYPAALEQALTQGRLNELRARRAAARAAGRLYGIGYSAVVEPSISSIDDVRTGADDRQMSTPALTYGTMTTVSVAVDPLGSVSVSAASLPQGQGHRTVLTQVVAGALGLPAGSIQVNTGLDSHKDAWSVTTGNYSAQFTGAIAGAVHLAVLKLREQIARLAGSMLNVSFAEIEFADARVYARGNPDNALTFQQAVAPAHWSPDRLPAGVTPGLRESLFWTPPCVPSEDHDKQGCRSLCHGFVFDFCGVEIDLVTAQVRLDRYVTLHDAGTLLHPALAEGQIRGAFAQAVGAALYEEFVYSGAGRCVNETLADYRIPGACEIPEPQVLYRQTPSPYTPLGAKGIGSGNCMSTPVCIANAVADALGVADLTLPLTPARLASLIYGEEPSPGQAGHS